MLPRSGEWLAWIEQLFGFVLVGLALYFLDPLLPNRIVTRMLPYYAVAVGVFLGFISRAGPGLSAIRLSLAPQYHGRLRVRFAIVGWPAPRRLDHHGAWTLALKMAVLLRPESAESCAALEQNPGRSNVLDLALHQASTPLMIEARARGGTVANGQASFAVAQQVAFRFWFGVEPPVEVIRAALGSALGSPDGEVAVAGN